MRAILENLVIVSLSLVLERKLSFYCKLSWARSISFVFLWGLNFGEGLSEHQCYILQYTMLHCITNNLNRLVTCSAIFSDEVLHFYFFSISSGFQDVDRQKNTPWQTCDVCQAVNMPLCWHLCNCCISLYKIVGLLIVLSFRILSTWCSTTWEKADPTAAAVDWRQRPGWQHSSWGIISVVIPNAFLIPVVFAVITFLTINSFDINASVIYCSTELPL